MAIETDCWYTTEVKNSSQSQTMVISNITLCCVNTLAIILNIFANSSVIYVYLRSRSRQPISNTLLFVMAVFDLLNGTLSHPLFIAKKILELHKRFVCTLNVVIKTMSGVFAGFSFIVTSFLLTSERLFAIAFPIRHRVFVRKRWIVAVSLSLFFVWATIIVSLSRVWKNDIALLVIVLFVITCGLVYTMAVYIKIYCVIRRSRALSVRKRVCVTSNMAGRLHTLVSESDGKQTASSRNSAEKTFRIGAAKRRKEVPCRNDNSYANVSKKTFLSDPRRQNYDLDRAANELRDLDFMADAHANYRQGKVLVIAGDSSVAQSRCDNNNCIIDGDGNDTTSTTTKVPGDLGEKCQGDMTSTTTKVPSDLGEKGQGGKSRPPEHMRNNSHDKQFRLKRAQNVVQNVSVSHKEKKTILRMMCIIGSLYITELPVLFFFIYTAGRGINVSFVQYFYPWSLSFAFCRTIINPFIYCYQNEHFWIRKPRRNPSQATLHGGSSLTSPCNTVDSQNEVNS